MTPGTMLSALQPMPDATPLVFRTDAGPAGQGYHVTELKLAHVTGIDCGARRETWAEATIQLLDGNFGDPMTVGKFKSILDQSIRTVDGLGAAPVQIEFSHGNDGLSLFRPADPVLSDAAVTIDLSRSHATCKPAAARSCSGPSPKTKTGCCT